MHKFVRALDNPSENRHIQLVCNQAIYKADFGEKSSKNMFMYMRCCPRPLKLYSLYEVSVSL